MIEPDDEQTARARRASPSPAPETLSGEPDDRTTPVIRAGRARQADSETTAVSSRAAAPDPGTTTASDDSTASAPPPGPRRVGRVEPAELSTIDAGDGPPRRHAGPDVARSQGPWGHAVEVPGGSGRAAQAPPAGPITYPARSVAPATAARAEPVRREPQALVDTAATEAAQRRRRRQRAVVVMVAASVLVLLAVAALAALVAVG